MVFATLVAVCTLALATGCRRDVLATPPAQPITVTDFLARYDLTGKVVLLEFGTIGCEKSGAGLDEMIDLDRHKIIPGLSFARLERSADRKAADAYYAKKAPAFPIHHDPNSAMARAFGATAYPAFVLVGKFGHVRYRGGFPDEHLSDWAEALVAETSDPGKDVPLFGAARLDIPKLLTNTRLPSVSNEKLRPLADYAGNGGLMIVFVDISCPFAGQAMTEIPAVAAKLAERDLQTVLVNVDDNRADTLEFHRELALPVPVAYDTTTGTRLRWGVSSVPTIFVLGADNTIHYSGPAVWERVARAAETSLGLNAGAIQFNSAGTEYG